MTVEIKWFECEKPGHLLGRLFEKVFVPAAMLEELTDARTPEIVRRWVASQPAWFEVRAVSG